LQETAPTDVEACAMRRVRHIEFHGATMEDPHDGSNLPDMQAPCRPSAAA
jgi:hypothetical protein